MRRVNVVGTSGSGKSTVGAALARQMDVPYVEIDALAWLPGWVQLEVDALRTLVATAVAGEAWVVDGNYSATRDLVWTRADTVVWLDLPFHQVMWRVVRRTLSRARAREVLWGTNQESLRMAIGRDSVIWWALTTYRRRRREYPVLFAQYPELRVIRLRSDAETRQFLAAMDAIPPPDPALPTEPRIR